MAPVTRRQKRKADDENGAVEKVSPPTTSTPQKGSPTHTTSTKNQPLVQALHNLSDAMLRAAPSSPPVHSRRSNRFKGVAVRRAANALADLDYEIVAGAPLAAPGRVGRGIGHRRVH